MGTKKHPLPLDPDHDWNDVPVDIDDALQVCDKILAKLDDIPMPQFLRSKEYYESTKARTNSIKSFITDNQRATPKQLEALKRWLAALEKTKR